MVIIYRTKTTVVMMNCTKFVINVSGKKTQGTFLTNVQQFGKRNVTDG
jgi:hypothetical protein